MKNKIILYTISLAACAFSACMGDHHSQSGADTAGRADSITSVNNPYRDTFKTTTTMGDAGVVDNGGSGGTRIARPKMQQVKADSVKN